MLFTACPVLALVVTLTAAAFLPLTAPRGLVSLDGDLVIVVSLLTLYALIVYASGTAPPSRYSLIGAERAVLMLIGFEIPLMLSCLSVAIAAGSLRISDIVLRQAERWYVLSPHVVAFIIFLVASQAELERVPFDIPEAETEIVAGWQVEYASWRLALFRLSRDVEMVLLSGLAAALFLGGPLGPTPPGLGWLLPPVYFLLKSALVLALLSVLRASFARIRIDQFVSFCWRYLIPASLAYLIIVVWVV
ncbi:MAG: NADH-quinone oxidoreductase subunit H, partial [Thermoprotei archaeon]